MSTTDQMLADSRKKSMLQYVSEGASVADLDAAGYTLDEISTLPDVNPKQLKALASSPEYNRDRQITRNQTANFPITSENRDRQSAPNQNILETYTPTTRDNWREGIRQGVSALGVSDQTAQFYADRIAGTGGNLGLVDVTGLGVIPGVQEGVQQAERGYKTGSKTDMAMGALGTGLNVLAAVPGGKLIAKGITKGVEKLAEKAIAASDNALVKSLDVPIDKTVEALKPSYKPTMFRTSDAGKIEVNPNSLMEFYSPAVETIRNVEFPAKGYKGSELLKFLKEKAPGVRRTEVDALDLKLDPQKRYTREEALAEVEKKAYKVYAEEVDDTVYKSQQRQDISDPEISFSTIKINATREGDTFMPRLGYTHYDPETIAHTRISIRENAEGKKYLLVEEIQSDLVQASGAKPRGALTRDEAYEEVIDSTLKNLASKNPEKLAVYKKNKELYDSMFKLASENTRIRGLQFNGIDVPKGELDNLEKIRNDTISYQNKGGSDSQLLSDFESLGYDAGPTMDRRMKAITKAPLTDNADAVRLTLQTAMAKADESDATSIVIPNLQRIVTAQGRGARYGTENYNKYMKAGSGFQKTYVDGVDSFIAQLKKEYGDAIKIEQIELPYKSKTTFYSDAMSGRDVPLDNTALRIDFSGLKGVNLKSGQFAEGGSVERKQMDKLMQDGGMADGGVAQEPVTGNEVPPGALPSEVRDNVPVQLSEGEYVVPADVLRFFGMRFFEDLRNQAKQGLAEMQSNGRIGGANVDSNGVPAQEDDQLTPEEEQMLNNALGSSAGMAEGGDVPFDRTTFTLDGSTSGMESRKYIDPTTGVTQDFQFYLGEPSSPIPSNFVPWTQALADAAAAPKVPTTPTTPGGTGNTGGNGGANERGYEPTGGGTGAGAVGGTGGGGFNYDNWAEKNYADITSNPYQFGIDALADDSGKLVSKGLGAVGILTGGVAPMVGSAVVKGVSKVQNIAEANAALQVMKSKGLEGTTDYNNLQKTIGIAIDALPTAQQLLVEKELAGTGNKYFESITRKAGTPTAAPAAPAAPAASIQSGSGSGGTPKPTPGGGGGQGGPGNVGSTGGSGGGGGSTPKPTPGGGGGQGGPGNVTPSKPTPGGGGGTGGPGNVTPSKPSTPNKPDSGGSNAPSKSTPSKSGSSRFKEGGLVTRTAKTAPKTKGLAGKQ